MSKSFPRADKLGIKYKLEKAYTDRCVGVNGELCSLFDVRSCIKIFDCVSFEDVVVLELNDEDLKTIMEELK